MSRNLIVPLLVLILAACGDSSSTSSAHQDSIAADVVYREARIYTVDDERTWAEAVAIRDGKLAYVGSNHGVDAFIGEDTLVYSLDGRLMLPGFQDIHVHPIMSGLDALRCDLNELPDLAAYRNRIQTYATSNPNVDWVVGGGWSMAIFGPGAMANRIWGQSMPRTWTPRSTT